MRSIIGSLVLITALTGCSSDSSDGNDNGSRALHAAMAPLPGGGTISGTADVQWTVGDAQFTASAQITGDVVGAVRPWHVHFGSCATGGDIVGPAGSYTPMTVGGDGAAASTALVDFELDASAPYHVNVHESQTALTTLIACGNLTSIGSMPSGGGGGDDTGGGDY